MPETNDGRERLVRLEQQLTDHCQENNTALAEIKSDIKEVKESVKVFGRELVDLKTNHVVFKTRVIAYWAVGTAVLSALLQLLFIYLSKHL